MTTKENIHAIYGNRLRVRVCGICIENDQILLVKHQSVGEKGYLWIPPGGGVEFGESVTEALKREFLEETGLQIRVNDLLFIHEYLSPPLHAIELFFQVNPVGGKLVSGVDPEMPQEKQIIENVAFKSLKTLSKEEPGQLHALLHHAKDIKTLLNLRGYFKSRQNCIK